MSGPKRQSPLFSSVGCGTAVLLVLVLATMTRETAVFILTFYAAYHYKPLLAKNKTQLIKLAGLIATFMITYALLRILFNGENAIFQQIRLLRNLTNPSALASIVLFIFITYILINRTDNPSHCLLFLLLSVPYILMIITVANPWEIRLWTPIWLGLLILGRLYIPAYTQT